MQLLEIKACLSCHKAVKGRTDKKFCDDYCRNNFNNQQKAETTNYARNIIFALKKNKRILESILGSELITRTTKERLLSKGFLFKYHTRMHENKQGNIYYYCFEYGYLALENDWYIIVKRNEEA